MKRIIFSCIMLLTYQLSAIGEQPEVSMQVNTAGFQTIQIIGTVMLTSGIFGQAIKAFEHDTGLKISSWMPLKHAEALLFSILIAYFASDLADDGKINSPVTTLRDKQGQLTWKSLLGFFTKKALWTVPSYLGWIGVDHAIQQIREEKDRNRQK